ncbi:UNVERIFIED_ORG: amino acid/amide ABC transporter membrane protein 2 (HAAT family) [Nocardia globerula]|uniref:Amino acid/amide ABC transporter membrane protein 2 (HAAT family) n=1 Tax=Nocardia globerula TaxID=1818 RepID=A0A652YNU3_NOCGL|nr:branched-chain amino acid ABC transporter permease [Rhodococcus globerulus]NMD62419.1 branched-chain amino acid ABC transporter permease [Nocardia globerula]PVX65482.1 branched-chain amino acid transport system permease protein [Rhodococcus globerulus]
MTTTLEPAPIDDDTAGVPSEVVRTKKRSTRVWVAVWVVAMLVVPWVVQSDLWMGVGIFALIAAVGALGMQVITGFAGQISMGHAVFMAIGAYTSAWLGVDEGLPVWVWLPAAAVVAGLAGGVVAPAAVRIRGLYLAVATLALIFIGTYVWETWTSLSGGVNGRTAPAVEINGQDLLDGYWSSGGEEILTSFQAWWYFALAVLLIVTVLTWNLKRSRLGRAFMAVRDRDIAAGVAGIPVTRTKVVAFVISSAFAGVSGALLVSYMGYFTPSQWTMMVSVDFIAMVVIGGMGTVAGAILGAFFIKAMPEMVNVLSPYLPFVSKDASADGGVTAPLLSQFLYGLVIVLVLIFEPKGLLALFKRPIDWIRARISGGSK